MRVSDEALYRLVDVYRKIHPAFVLTHSLADPYNFDHPARRAAWRRKRASSPRRTATSRARP